MKRVALILIPFLVLILGCEKDKWISDELKEKQYYEKEIFPVEYLDIYGNWELVEVYGGLAGTFQDFPPESYLQIVEYGIYGFLEGDSITRCGKIVILETEFDFLLIEFEDSTGHRVRYAVSLKDEDTLELRNTCADCYTYSYKRKK